MAFPFIRVHGKERLDCAAQVKTACLSFVNDLLTLSRGVAQRGDGTSRRRYAKMLTRQVVCVDLVSLSGWIITKTRRQFLPEEGFAHDDQSENCFTMQQELCLYAYPSQENCHDG